MAHDSRFRSESAPNIAGLDPRGNALIDPFFLSSMGSTTPDFRSALSADLPVIAASGPTLAPTPARWAEVEARVTRRTKETLR